LLTNKKEDKIWCVLVSQQYSKIRLKQTQPRSLAVEKLCVIAWLGMWSMHGGGCSIHLI